VPSRGTGVGSGGTPAIVNPLVLGPAVTAVVVRAGPRTVGRGSGGVPEAGFTSVEELEVTPGFFRVYVLK